MTEAEWLVCGDVDELLRHLRRDSRIVRSPIGRRKLRLFACGCCRQVWQLIEDHRSRRLVELSEQLADGLADPLELAAAEDAARSAKSDADAASAGLSSVTHIRKVGAAIGAALQTAAKESYEAARVSSGGTLCSVGGHWNTREPNPAWEAQAKRQADLLRCIFGNPFRPSPTLAPSILAHNGGTALRLAAAIYEGRAFDRLPVLADALEDAGCGDAEVLGHCRSGGEHVRGCWVVDLVLGKA
jgi:hypothetical protein